MYIEATATAEKYNGTVKELTEAQEKYGNVLKDIQSYQDNMNQKAVDAAFDKTEKRLGSISEIDKNRWSSQYD